MYRAGSGGLPTRAGTTLLLLHQGQPRTPYYTKTHLTKLWEHYRIPAQFRSPLTEAYWRLSSSLRKCVTDSEYYPSIDQTLDSYAEALQKSLTKVVPEFKPINVRSAFLFDSPSIENRIDDVISTGTDSLIILPAYPFDFHPLTSSILKNIEIVIEAKTTSFGHGIHEDRSTRIVPNSHVSFNVSKLSNIGANESIIQYWSERLRANLDDFDSVIFAVPLPLTSRLTYTSTLTATARRIMYVLYESYPRAVPFRVAYYSPWHAFWPTTSTQTVANRLKDLRKHGRTRTLVVPINELFPAFDTATILPDLVDRLDVSDHVRLLAPETHDSALIHSLTELVKNALLVQKLRKQSTSSNVRDLMSSME